MRKRKCLSLLLSFALVLCTCATGAFAAENAATVNGTSYATLSEAFQSAPSGATIVLQNDVTVTGENLISSNKKLTLDLNGHQISGKFTADKTAAFVIQNGADYTLTDSKAGGAVTVSSDTDYVFGIYMLDNAKFTLSGGALNVSGKKAIGVFGDNGDQIALSGGRLQTNASDSIMAVDSGHGGKVVLSGTAVNSVGGDKNSASIYLDNNDSGTDPSSFTMTGGSITSDYAGIMGYKDYSVSITGGSVVSKNANAVDMAEKGSAVIGGTSKIQAGQMAVISYGAKVTVNGSANIKGQKDGVYLADVTEETEISGSPVISGTAAGIFAGNSSVTIKDTPTVGAALSDSCSVMFVVKAGATPVPKLTINGGNFVSATNIVAGQTDGSGNFSVMTDTKQYISITGGVFTGNPSSYLSAEYAATALKTGNGFSVAAKTATPAPTTTPASTPTHPSAKFTDVDSTQWYVDAVDYAVTNKLFSGTTDTTFAPNGEMDRAMLVMVMYRLAGSPESTGKLDFTDVPAGCYYEKALLWATQNKLVSGVSATTFAPNASVTREQAAVILCNYAKMKGVTVTASGDLSAFSDGASVDAYAADAMKWAVGSGVLSGSNGKLMPTAGATRAQVAAILMRSASKLGK